MPTIPGTIAATISDVELSELVLLEKARTHEAYWLEAIELCETKKHRRSLATEMAGLAIAALGKKGKRNPGDYVPSLEQRKQWHPPATTKEEAVRRLRTVAARIGYRGLDYDVDILLMEILPLLKAKGWKVELT